MPAGSVYAAPIGTKPGDAGWKLVGHTVDGVTMTEPFTLDADKAQLRFAESDLQPHQDAINQMIANMKRASDRYSIRRPVKWSTTIDAMPSYTREQLKLYYGIDPVIINERSKPVGLTKEHVYKDKDGDIIEIHKNDEEPHAVIGVKEGYYAYIQPEYSLPLAINVLGYDRPSAEPYASTATEYNGQFANTPIPTSKEARDANIAKAVDLLIGADIADQRIAANKAADEVKAAKAAKLEARISAKEFARVSLASAVNVARDFGISPSRADELIAAASDYKAAVAAVGSPL